MCWEPESDEIQADAISWLVKKMKPEFEIITLILGKVYAASMRNWSQSSRSSHWSLVKCMLHR